MMHPVFPCWYRACSIWQCLTSINGIARCWQSGLLTNFSGKTQVSTPLNLLCFCVALKQGCYWLHHNLLYFLIWRCFCLAVFISVWVLFVCLHLASGYSNLLIHPIRGPNFVISVINRRIINSIFPLKEKYGNSYFTNYLFDENAED